MDGSTFLASLTGSGGASAASPGPSATLGNGAVIQFNHLLDSFPVRGNNVTLLPSSSSDSSAKLSIRNIVNFGWDHSLYPGQVVSVSADGRFLAYAIVTPGKSSEGVVRVVHRKTEERTLLKGMKGKVKDVAFAHTKNQTILGCVDEFGNLFVFSISENPSDSSLRHELLLEVTADPDEAISDYHRIIWCPYLPDDEDEEDEDDPDSPSRQLVVTRGRVAEIWNLDMVVTAHGTKVSRAQYKKQSDGITGRLVIDDHEAAITDAAFSPDGTAIATSSLDGRVKFFQCYLAGASESSPPRCLHKWSPHDGRPVSCLFFLDDHKVHDPAVQFWKYAVTGADNNSELKVWSCETWTCLQTVRFQQPEAAGGGQKRLALKAAMDLAANFLILSDIYRKRVYALHFKQRGKDVGVISVSEFATPSAFLSMSVVSAGVEKITDEHQNYEDRGGGAGNRSEDEMLEDMLDIEEMEELMNSSSKNKKAQSPGAKREATVVEMVIVQPKSLQQCRIVYDDAAGIEIKREVFDIEDDGVIDIALKLKENDIKLEPVMPKLVMVSPPDVKPNLSRLSRVGDEPSDLSVAAQTITLMSPDAFAAPPSNGTAKTNSIKINSEVKIKDEILGDDSLIGSVAVAVSTPIATAAAATGSNGQVTEVRSARSGLIPRSGQSSPSREVQDILCETEAIGGLGTEVIITEEDDYEEDDEDIDDDEDEEEQFKNLDKTDPLSLRTHAHPPDASTLSNPSDWPSFSKKTASAIKTEPLNESLTSVAEMRALMSKMDDISRLLTSQRSEMQQLREEVMEGRRSDRQKVEQLIRQSGQTTTGAIKSERKAVTDAVATSLGKTVSSRVEAAVATEMKRVAPGLVQGAMANVSATIERDLQGRVGKADAQLKEAVSKAVQSRAVAEAIGSAVATGLQAPMQNAFRDSLNITLVPAFEKAVQNMFVQLSTTFARGVKEHEALVKKTADPLIKELRTLSAATNQQQKDNKPNELLGSIRESVASEVGHAFERHARSLSTTPLNTSIASPSSPATVAKDTFADCQRMVRTHLARVDFDSAFQTALSANSLALVVDTCEMVNPTQVFNPPCPLTQNVLLALIQQLGHSLDDRTEIKHRFLEESVMNLDSQNSSTRHHMSAILGGLQKQLRSYIGEHPNQKMTKPMKMLLMATQSLLTTD